MTRRLVRAAVGAAAALGALALVNVAIAAGPPYPDPIPGKHVYDTADALTDADVGAAEQQIQAIEARTGAQIVVYTQVKPESDTPEAAEADAAALGTQWGVGRKGFDDGLVILFDLDPSLCHGQVQLYAAKGFAAAFLSNADRQRIYEDTMLPDLRACRLGAALTGALREVDAAATPEHAASLERARQIDAVLGLGVAPLLLVVLVGFASWRWLRFGKDPIYLDDPSIHIPAPPPDLTPASAALVWDGRSSRHALTTAMLDLAAHGEIAFRQETTGLLIHQTKVGIETEPQVADTASLRLVRRNPIGPAEQVIRNAVRTLDGRDAAGYLEPKDVLGLATKVESFNKALETHVVDKGWFREPPAKAMQRWFIIAGGEGIGGVGALILGFNLPSQGFVLVGASLVAAAVITALIARQMPARTMAGAMIRAMLAAYRRTLEKTMAMARSMEQVVAEAKLDWLETPDLAVVWGVALGLQAQVQSVLERTVEDAQSVTMPSTGSWLPAWYVASAGGGSGGSGGGGGLMSSSPIPNFGAMMATIGTIGSAPSSSGSGGGFGGGGGFSGGGAGGGF